MKKILILTLIFSINTVLIGQTDSTKTTGYLSAGVSLSNGDDFSSNSFPSIEGGIMRNNLTFGLAIGRGSFTDIFKNNDAINNYYYEGRFTASFPLGGVSGCVILGYGGYFDTNHMFIEYGVGTSYTRGKICYGVSVTNWDGKAYLTPSLMLNF